MGRSKAQQACPPGAVFIPSISALDVVSIHLGAAGLILLGPDVVDLTPASDFVASLARVGGRWAEVLREIDTGQNFRRFLGPNSAADVLRSGALAAQTKDMRP